MKSPRNKTLDIGVDEGQKHLEKCVSVTAPCDIGDIRDKTVLGDFFSVAPLLPEGFADLIIADPPYNLAKDFGGRRFSHRSDKSYREYTESWIRLIKPLLKPDGSVYVCCDWRSGMIIGDVLSEHFKLRSRITWQREKGRGSKRNWKNCMEDIWFATCSDSYTFNYEAVKLRRRVVAPYRVDGKPKDWEETEEGNFRNTFASNFWDDISIPYWSMAENTAHPTQKPEKLLAKLILASSNEGDLVFDPFLGSGSTSVTAKKLGRHYSGIEQILSTASGLKRGSRTPRSTKPSRAMKTASFLNATRKASKTAARLDRKGIIKHYNILFFLSSCGIIKADRHREA